MICERCGSFIPDDSLTCDHCGAFQGEHTTGQDTGVRAIRQGRADSYVPTLPVRHNDKMKEYGDYDLSPLPVEKSDRPRRSKPISPADDSFTGSRPSTHRGVPVKGTARATASPRKSVHAHPVRRHNINWMLIGLICTVLAIGGGIGYMLYMSQSEVGQLSTARKNVLECNETLLALAQTKDVTLLTEQEELLKKWNRIPAVSYWSAGDSYVDEGDLDTALIAYRMADLLDPENYDGLMELASTYELKNEDDKAEEIYLRLINDISPFRGEAYTSIIRLYQNNDRGPEAAEMMQLAYTNTDRETFRLQRRDYIPQSPQTSLIAGRYEISAMNEDVTLTSPQGFDVYYTVDDDAVLPEDGILFDGGALQVVEGSVTLRAVCVNGSLVSDPLSVSYTFYYPSPPAPKCNLAPNTYKTAREVSLRAGTREEYTKKQQAEMEKNLTYYYTIDGSTPTEESPVYDGTPIKLPSGKVTLKAVCVNQYGKMSSILEVGYQFKIKPDPLEMYAYTDVFAGFELYSTNRTDFEATYGAPNSEEPVTYLYLDAEAVHLAYNWGYAVFAKINNVWLLVRVEMNSSIATAPRGVGFGSSESEVCGVYKDFGQLQSPNGTRGLYYKYPQIGQVLIDENGTRYIQYTCQSLGGQNWVLQYWLDNDRVNKIVHFYQP
ncbi:MAG: chitobiase/beta-hexosaminidase C-terminal domain-containing protein [Eubacteriales bacterium]|nr:chitobiase/beta-hexosaminidase C-terminal domain-containing protein [Eubacteriales bacterium]